MKKLATFIMVLLTLSLVGCATSTSKETKDVSSSSEDSSLQDEIIALRNEKTSLSDENTVLRNENTSLRSENASLQSENASLQDENASLQSENASLQDENASLQSENSSLRNENASLQGESISLQNENSSLRNENASLQNENASLRSENTLLKEQLRQQVNATSSPSPLPTSKKTTVSVLSTSLVIPQIPLESEEIKASTVFCGQSFNLFTCSEDMREHIAYLTLPYYGEPIVRTCDVVLSGITVNAIYRMDSGNWTAIEGLQFNNVDNTYLSSLYIEGTDVNVFMVQTVNGTHYYFGIRSQH